MRGRWIRAAAATLCAALFLSQQAAAAEAPQVSARSAVVLDGVTGRVLYEKDADKKSLIASTTKIMTALVALEQFGLDETVTVPQEAVGVEGSSIYLQKDERITVRELLYGVMLQSGNDAATALAAASEGGAAAFVDRMNGKARQLGLTRTHFANPSGLDDPENYSTARELAKLSAYAMENETFRTLVSTKTIQLGQRSFVNHNKLLWRYAGAEGVKTGYTKQAGRILVSAASNAGRRLICVTICAPDDWRDHAALLDCGFQTFTPQTLAQKGQVLGSVPLIGSEKAWAEVLAAEDAVYPLAEGEEPELSISGGALRFAPVKAGELAGTAEFSLQGNTIVRIPVVWKESAARPPEQKRSLWDRIWRRGA